MQGEGGYYIHPTDTDNAYTVKKKFNVLVQLVTFSTFILSDSSVSHSMPWWPVPGTAVWMWALSLAQLWFQRSCEGFSSPGQISFLLSVGSFFQKPIFNTILSAAVSWGCQNKTLDAVNYRLTQVINMTVYVGKNSDRNAIIPPHTSLSGSLKPHGLYIASVNWLTLGKFPSHQQNQAESRCFSYFLWISFFQPKIRF